MNPFGIKAMKMMDIDISCHRSKSVDGFIQDEFDLVVTVCDAAKETCPYFPNAKKIVHAGFKDPSCVTSDENNKLDAFINTRDEIKKWLDSFLVI